MQDSAHSQSQSPRPEAFTLHQTLSMPLAEVGGRVHELNQLLQYGLAIPETFVLPAELIKKLYEHNHFIEKLNEYFSQIDWKQSQFVLSLSQLIQEEILQLRFPPDLQKAITTVYVSALENSYIQVEASLLFSHDKEMAPQEVLIKGEANLSESILHLIASLYRMETLRNRFNEWVNLQSVPCAIIIQEMIDAYAGGTAHTIDPFSGDKYKVLITSGLGNVHHFKDAGEYSDSFTVDTQKWQISQSHIPVKEHLYEFQPDHMEAVVLPDDQRGQSSLKDDEVIGIAKFVAQIGQRQFTPQIVKWAVAKNAKKGNRFYLLDIVEPVNGKTNGENSRPQTSHTTPNSPQIFISLSTPFPDPQLTQNAAGIGLFRSEHLFLQLEQHPAALLQNGKRELILYTLTQALKLAHSHYPQMPILYRSQNLTSNELSFFENGSAEETIETNPSFGYRGGVRILHNYQLFDTELEAISEIQQNVHAQIELVLPFIRSSVEFGIIKKHILKREFSSTLSQHIWLGCDTPENLFEIEQYLPYQPKGVIINIQQIHALMYGIDPENPALFDLYPYNLHLLKLLLKKVREQTQMSGTKVHIYLEKYHRELVMLAHELKLDGVTVQPNDFAKAKEIWP